MKRSDILKKVEKGEDLTTIATLDKKDRAVAYKRWKPDL